MIDYLFWTIFGLILLYSVVRIIRYGGLRQSILGGKIKATLGEYDGVDKGICRRTLRAHVMERSGTPEKFVCFEIIGKTPLSYQMLPVTITFSDAQRLAEVLTRAAVS